MASYSPGRVPNSVCTHVIIPRIGGGIRQGPTNLPRVVWSSIEGYPGDYVYREYYRDIGFDLEYDYIRPYISSCGNKNFLPGLKYYRITGETPEKNLIHLRMPWRKRRSTRAISCLP